VREQPMRSQSIRQRLIDEERLDANDGMSGEDRVCAVGRMDVKKGLNARKTLSGKERFNDDKKLLD
jgi:hypothetical protein